MADSLHTTATEFAALIPEMWSSNFYDTLLEALPFNDSVSRDWEGEISGLGDTVNISQFPQFSEADDIAEDQRVDAEAVTVSNLQLVINHELAKDFIVTQRAMRQALDGDTQLKELAMFSIMKKMQSIIISDTVPSASAPDHQIAYDSGTTLALADILEAKELKDSANVSKLGRVMILDAPQANDLYNISGFTSRDFVPSGSPLSSAEFPVPVLGYTVKETTEASNVAYLFHPSYLTVAMQMAPQVTVHDLGVDGKRAARVNTTMLMGSKQLSNLRVVEIA